MRSEFELLNPIPNMALAAVSICKELCIISWFFMFEKN
jgi:hypothetical protein